MSPAEALAKIREFYVPGVSDFYARMNPDRWQQAHDKLEAVMTHYTGFPDYRQRLYKACDEFVQDCQTLVEAAKAFLQPTQLSLSDALHIGDEKKVVELEAFLRGACMSCGSESSTVRVVAQRNRKAGLYCETCIP